MPTLFGTDPNQVPTNADLGSLAFTDGKGAGNISAGTVDVIRANKVTNVSSIRPSLDLNFMTKKLDPRVTFTRSSIGTYVGADGYIKTAVVDEPRFDHDPVTGECKGLLIEETRTNLLLQSSQFDVGAAWNPSANGVITANAIVSPDGTLTADMYTANDGSYALYQPVVVSPSTTYTFSFYIKRGTTTELAYSVYDVTNATTFIPPTTYYAQTNSSSWTRISVTFTTPVGCAAIRVYPSRDTGVTGTFYVWGAQCELGSFATSYIPTTTTTVTRELDQAYITNVSWYNQLEGTMFVDFTAFGFKTVSLPFLLSDDISPYITNSIRLGASDTQIEYRVTTEGVNYVIVDVPTQVIGTRFKNIFAFKENDFVMGFNNTGLTKISSGAMPTINTLYIAMRPNNSGNKYNGTIKRLTYYPKRLSDAELKELTK